MAKESGVQWRGSRGSTSNSFCGPLEPPVEPDQLERYRPTENDPIHLKRRVGLVSGVALIVGTMIGIFFCIK